jgi:PTS system nitrogen regulatory IIA component
MQLFEILSEDCCSADLTGKNKTQILEELGRLAAKNPILSKYSPTELTAKLQEREELGSTGFADGIAIPHTRLPDIDQFVLAIGVQKAGIDFQSLDKKKAKIFVVIIGPESQANEHLKILASVSRTLGNAKVRTELLSASKDSLVYEGFLRNTDSIRGTEKTKRKMKLLIMVLYLEELLFEILEYFMQEGIEGATIIDSQGMGEYISKAPLFATFMGVFNQDKNHSKTIMALIPDERLDAICDGLDRITGDMESKQGAMILALDVPYYRGTMEMV